MKTALLCNGPSRVAFNSELLYNYTIGCNIPWTKVDSTVVMDAEVLNKYDCYTRFYSSRIAWRDCIKKEKLIGHLIGLFDSLPEYDSAGHAAARILLQIGAKQIDVYGCDSWFDNTTESYTHKYVDSRSTDMTKHVRVWKQRWEQLMEQHPEVTFNFIGA